MSHIIQPNSKQYRLSLWKTIQLAVSGRCQIDGHYMFYCKKHGLQESHLHGWSKYLLCPECLKEQFGE